jgi:tetratricopeptide (TPR) repeat protein
MNRLLTPLAALIIGLTVVIAWSSLRMNLSEIAWQLQKQEFIEGNLTRMYLVARFVDQRKLYLEEIDRSSSDWNEFEISHLLDSRTENDFSDLKVVDILDRVSLNVVNTLRQTIGKPLLVEWIEMQSLDYLGMAFRLERIREYQKALDIYDKTAPMIHDPVLLGVLLLHKGYCLALLGEIPKAKDLYQRVIAQNRHNDQGVTASLLLQHLDQIVLEQKNLLNAELPELVRARKMPLLMQCNALLNSLKPEDQAGPAEQAEVLMVRGLCEEEIGNKGQALKNYLGAIKVAGNDSLARDANRRVYLMGTQITNGKRIEALAEQINQSLGDTMLVSMGRQNLATTKSLPQDAYSAVPIAVIRDLEISALSIIRDRKPLETTTSSIKAPPPSFGPGLHSFVRVDLKNGKTFTGEVLSLPEEKVLRIRTMIGIIGVRRDEIISIQAQ